MRRLGLIGGMSWQSTAVYYRQLNEIVHREFGGLHSADLLMRSLDFADIADRQHRGDWDGAARILVAAAQSLEIAGAEALILCTNTMHLLAERITAACAIPLVHIADATAEAIRRSGARTPLLLATRFTMEGDFYRRRLLDRAGIAALIPDEPGRKRVHRIIYEELCEGLIRPESRRVVTAEIDAAAARGADGVILGCTELALLIGQGDTELPVFDTTWIHAQAAMDFALAAEDCSPAGAKDVQ
jgi:aspartate racemase